MAVPPDVMSVVALEAQRIVPPSATRPPALAPNCEEVFEPRIWSVPVEARVKPPVKVFVPLKEAELPMIVTVLFVAPSTIAGV